MKKLISIGFICFGLCFTSKAQITYPNVITNDITKAVITYLQNYFQTNNNVWGGSNYFPLLYVNGIKYGTNLWLGPTNVIDLNLASQSYKTFTPISINGWSNVSPAFVGATVLTITNAATTNITMTLNTSITTDDGGRAYVVTNGTIRVFSLRLNPSGFTNDVSRTFF